MKHPKPGRLLCVLCWLGAAMCGVLTGYMIHFTRMFPEVDDFARNAYLALALTLLWLGAAVYFTRRERKNKEK